MSKLTDFGLPDLRKKQKEQEFPEEQKRKAREQERAVLLAELKDPPPWTVKFRHRKKTFELRYVYKSGLAIHHYFNCTYAALKKIYPEVHQRLIELGAEPYKEGPQLINPAELEEEIGEDPHTKYPFLR